MAVKCTPIVSQTVFNNQIMDQAKCRGCIWGRLFTQPRTGPLITQPAALSVPSIAPCVNNCEANKAGAAGADIQEQSLSGLTPDKLMLISVYIYLKENKLLVSQT